MHRRRYHQQGPGAAGSRDGRPRPWAAAALAPPLSRQGPEAGALDSGFAAVLSKLLALRTDAAPAKPELAVISFAVGAVPLTHLPLDGYFAETGALVSGGYVAMLLKLLPLHTSTALASHTDRHHVPATTPPITNTHPCGSPCWAAVVAVRE